MFYAFIDIIVKIKMMKKNTIPQDRRLSKRYLSLDECLLATGFGKYNIGILLLSGCILIGMIFESLGTGYFIPAAQCDLKLNISQKGWLGAIPFIGNIITAHLWGWLADTRGRKPVIMFSMVLGAFFSVLSSLCPDLLSFAILRFIAAMFCAGPSAVAYVYLSEFNKPSQRDRMVIIGSSFISVGVVILPALAWLTQMNDFRIPVDVFGIVYRPWRLLIAVLTIPYFLCSCLMIIAPESPKFLVHAGKTEEAMKVFRSMYHWNTGNNGNSFENVELEIKSKAEDVSFLRSMWNQTVPLFKKPLVSYMILICFVQLIIFACANGFYIWLPEIFNRVINEENSGSSGTVCDIISTKTVVQSAMVNNSSIYMGPQCTDIVYTGTYLRTIIIRGVLAPFLVLSGFVVNTLGKHNILVSVPLISGLSAYAVYWCTNNIGSLFLLGLFQLVGCCISMMNAVVVEIFPTHLRAMAVCLSLMFGRLGSVIGSFSIGYLIEVNCSSTFFIFGSLLLVTSGVCLLLYKTEKRVDEPETIGKWTSKGEN